ncbi:MAG: hypothetical protein ACYCXF_03975 [Thermoleophilia bacterium]
MKRGAAYCGWLFLLLSMGLIAGGCGEDRTTTGAGLTESVPVTTRAARSAQPMPANPSPPAGIVKLVFVHHSVGENWLEDVTGGLGKALQANDYFVSDTSYGWGPADRDTGDGRIGDHTDIGHWYNWFLGPNSGIYLNALYKQEGGSALYQRDTIIPQGETRIIIFKSCFTNSSLDGNPDDPPVTGENPLRGIGSGTEFQTVGNAKGIYRDLLGYFAIRPDKLFIVVTAPPNVAGEATPAQAANARAFNRWLVQDWLQGYEVGNVAVFDLFNVLTSNGGSPDVSDAGSAAGNHHRYNSTLGAIEYTYNQGGDFAAYSQDGDSHPSSAGLKKATDEFVPWLNVTYHAWKGE